MANKIVQSEYELGNLTTKSKGELLYLLARQSRLLENEKFLSKLPDKGQKIQATKDVIERAIERVESVENAEKLFGKLTLETRQKSDEDETTERYEDPLPSIETELRTLASRGQIFGKAERSRQQPAAKLSDPKNDRFMLNRAKAKPEIHSANQTRAIVDKTWVETAVTPPPAKFTEAKPITLEESFKIQVKQDERLKKLQIEQAAAQLASRMGIVMGETLIRDTAGFTRYRDVISEDEEQPSDVE